MERIREQLEGLEARFAEHPWPDSLERIAGELDALAAYARLAAGVEPEVEVELHAAADMMRQCWALIAHDGAGGRVTDASKAARMWYLLGELLDRTQDILAAKPAGLPDFVLDALSVILPWIGSSASVSGAEAAHAGSIVGAQAHLEQMLWHHFTARREPMDAEAAWEWVERKREVVARVRDLVFTRTAGPGARAAILVLLYLSLAVSRVNRLRERLAARESPAT